MTQQAKYCLNCGRKLDADEQFCSACGHKVALGSTTIPVKETKAKEGLKVIPKTGPKEEQTVDLNEFKRSLEQSKGIDPGQVKIYFDLVSSRFRHNTISLDEYRELVKQIVLRDTQGRIWTIGARTGKWYWKDAGRWTPGIPQGQMVFENTKTREIKAIYCRKCGTSLQPSAKFCNKCGTPRTL